MHPTKQSAILTESMLIKSSYLEREVKVDIYFPPSNNHEADLLLVNDGQDLVKMDFVSILDNHYSQNELKQNLLIVGIHCGPERKREYGVAAQSDYKGRGDKAGAYTRFIMEELQPLIYSHCKSYTIRDKAFAGFSLGALSAMDIVWNHPHEFKIAGCFSSSFWWRSLDQFDPAYDDDKNRIMHQQVRKGDYAAGLKFFFQCGNMDETRDRNKNGIIDSIDDTLDLIKELTEKGYEAGKDIFYLEIKDGHHDVGTWGRAFPVFLNWAWRES